MIKKPVPKPKASLAESSPTVSPETSFAEVVRLIESARQRAYHAVNTELIDLYWRVGEFISRKIETDGWGNGTIASLATFIQRGSRVSAVSPRRISGECASSSRHTGVNQFSHRC